MSGLLHLAFPRPSLGCCWLSWSPAFSVSCPWRYSAGRVHLAVHSRFEVSLRILFDEYRSATLTKITDMYACNRMHAYHVAPLRRSAH